jgi:hypothetical protein
MTVPDLAPRQRLLVLQRIMRDQAAFLATRTMPSDDFGSSKLGGREGGREGRDGFIGASEAEGVEIIM